MKRRTANLLLDCKNLLGEGIQWNQVDQRIYWTDIFGQALWSCDEHGRDVKKSDLPQGLSAFAFRRSGPMLCAFFDGLYDFDPETGNTHLIRHYQPELGNRTRMNDGNLDPRGRFIVGGMDERGMNPITPVWSVTSGHVSTIAENIGCANSICFSPDGTVMYFADSGMRSILAYDYDLDTGMPHNERVFARLGPDKGIPDGSCVDEDGGLWNAQFGGNKVQRYRPDGSRCNSIDLPVPNVTCCAIGGMDLNRMFITTSRLGMSAKELRSKPLAGGLFAIDLDVIGKPHGTYAG